MLRQVSLLAFVAFLLAAPQGAAQTSDDTKAGAESRIWTSDDGKFTTEAVLLSYKLGEVTLQKTDGKSVNLPLARLSEEDQAHVRQVAPEDQESLQALAEREVELDRNDEGRVVAAQFSTKGRINRRDVELLAGLPNLERLSLAQVRLASGTLDHVELLSGLRQLDLTASGIGNSEVKQITVLKNIEALSLADTQITNRALTYLPELPKLTELSLANTRIADNGISNLEELKQLKKLNLGNTRVSPRGVLRLRKALPNTEMAGSGVIRR